MPSRPDWRHQALAGNAGRSRRSSRCCNWTAFGNVGRELVALTNALAQTSGPRRARAVSWIVCRPSPGGWFLCARRPSRRVTSGRGAHAHRAAALQADLPGAIKELAKLPAPARAAAQAWIAKAQARLAAIAASRRFAADAFAALGKTPEAR
jgi:hypothetical protein